MSQYEVRPGVRLHPGRERSSSAGRQGIMPKTGTWQGKEKSMAVQVRRGMLGRTARAKVWEERIEEDQEREEALGQHVASGTVPAKTRTSKEIGVFDAKRYFRGGTEQAGWREDHEQIVEVEGNAHASGDLPLSPLVEFGKASKQWLSDAAVGSSSGILGQQKQWAGAAVLGRQPCVQSSDQFASPRTSTASSLSELDPPLISMQQRSHATTNGTNYKQPSKKPQPASPNSSRLASFLAKFKPAVPHHKSPTASKSVHHLESGTPPPRPTPSTTPSPHVKKFLPHALFSPGAINGKATTQRGRLLHAFSSTSSGENPVSGTSLRHHGSFAVATPQIATSSPVSPAARSAPDPYSPVAKSTSTTPTSGRISRSTASLPSPYGYDGRTSSLNKPSIALQNWRHSPGSFKQQLPFLSRKLKVYLMPEKIVSVAKQASSSTSKSKVPGNGIRNSERDEGELFSCHYPCKEAVDERQRRTRWLYAEDQAVDEDIELAERLLRVVQDHQTGHLNSGALKSDRTFYNQPGLTKSGLSVNGYNNGHHITQSTLTNGMYHGDRVSEYSSRKYDQMHPPARTGGVSHHHVTANLVTHLSPITSGSSDASCRTKLNCSNFTTRHVAAGTRGPDMGVSVGSMELLLPPPGGAAGSCALKVEESCGVYDDSDSSSDLFEIETSLACEGGGTSGIHMRRDLPVYQARESLPPPPPHYVLANRFSCINHDSR